VCGSKSKGKGRGVRWPTVSRCGEGAMALPWVLSRAREGTEQKGKKKHDTRTYIYTWTGARKERIPFPFSFSFRRVGLFHRPRGAALAPPFSARKVHFAFSFSFCARARNSLRPAMASSELVEPFYGRTCADDDFFFFSCPRGSCLLPNTHFTSLWTCSSTVGSISREIDTHAHAKNPQYCAHTRQRHKRK
jgi:hypothetical protein